MEMILAPEAIERGLSFFAVVGPLTGLIAGTLLGAHEKCAWPKMLRGALIGGMLTLVYGGWHLYGAITDSLGLDRLASLVLQLVVFAVIGAISGALLFWISTKLRGSERANNRS
jgi:predicted membrane protein